MRDMNKYLSDFDALPFEKIQAKYRKKKFFENVSTLKNINSVLEVGCGTSSIFETKKFKSNYLVEPIKVFCDRLSNRINVSDIVIKNCFLEESRLEKTFDLVVLSCVLHEVPDADRFLREAIKYLNPNGYIYIDVPNAKSLHRQLAVATGYLKSIYVTSTTQQTMQQSANIFTRETLKYFLEQYGLNVIDSNGFFIKPFHHERMQFLVDQGVISDDDLEGFFILGNLMGEFGSEIYAIANKSKTL